MRSRHARHAAANRGIFTTASNTERLLGTNITVTKFDQSRNRRFGLALASGLTVSAAEQSVGQVVEGVGAAREVMRQARRIPVEMPIAEQVNKVLREGAAPADAVRALLSRPPGSESY